MMLSHYLNYLMSFRDAYTPRPKVLHLKELYDFKRYISDGGVGNVKVLTQLNNISFNHIFMIKKNEISGSTLLYAEFNSSWSLTNAN